MIGIKDNSCPKYGEQEWADSLPTLGGLCGLFFELMRVSIGAQGTLSRLPSEQPEWKELYEMAVKQSLVGVCFAGIQHLGADSDDGFSKIGMSEDLYFDWMGAAAQLQLRNDVVNERCVELQKRLVADGLRSCVLKGQGVAALYGEELRGFRQSGDIDLWIDASREKVIDYVMGLAPTKEFDQKHIHFHCFKETEVECHWIPVKRNNPFHDKILEGYFNGERERQFSHVIDELCVPTTDFQLIHQLLHVYSHYMYEGVGLRQMMDLYFAQRAVRNNDNDNLVRVLDLFKRLGLMKFVGATQWVLQKVFGMTEDVLLSEPDEKEGRKFLDEIMIGGNFGHHDERNQVVGESFVRRFLRRWGRKFRMFRFDPLGTLIMPLSRLKLEFWMRSVRRKYNV